MDTTQLAALAAALGWASGLRLYAVVFVTGVAGWLGWVTLPGDLQVLQQPLVLGVSGTLLVVEFLADKLPWVDSAWDAMHTFIRIPAGAALAAGVFGAESGAWTVAAALLGGSLAATAHAAKTSTRAAVNTSPEPFSNLALSLVDDVAAPAMVALAWMSPAVFFVVLALALVAMVALIVLMFKFTRGLLGRLRQHFGGPSAGA